MLFLFSTQVSPIYSPSLLTISLQWHYSSLLSSSHFFHYLHPSISFIHLSISCIALNTLLLPIHLFVRPYLFSLAFSILSNIGFFWLLFGYFISYFVPLYNANSTPWKFHFLRVTLVFKHVSAGYVDTGRQYVLYIASLFF